MVDVYDLNPVPGDDIRREQFKELSVETPHEGDKKILVLDAPKLLLPYMSGGLFNTGHHTAETLIPMHHFDKVGFEFDIASQDGAPLALEERAFLVAVGH